MSERSTVFTSSFAEVYDLMGTDIELLVAGNCVARKEDQDSSLRVDYRGMFEPD
jgi:hypothetical protein